MFLFKFLIVFNNVYEIYFKVIWCYEQIYINLNLSIVGGDVFDFFGVMILYIF